jgi:tRNA nucleotidyltransferase (CCA-adding enzyme)
LKCALLDRVREQPGGEALLGAAYDGVHLVGGAVRDLLRAERPRELDVLVEGPIEPLLRDLGGETVKHDRFETASVWLGDARIDVARARRERYPHPGALPLVEPASVEEDLLRRDFSVNAIALSLTDARMRAAPHAEVDIARGVLRVLHEQSFSDDPTRLLRLARYGARLGFEVEEHTAALAQAALAAQALDTVSGARIGAELRLALSEPDALAALAAMRELGVLGALHPRLRFEQSTAREALALLPEDGRPDLALLAALVLPLALRAEGDPRAEIVALLDRWEIPAGDRDRVAAAAVAVPRLIEELPAAEPASALRAVARGVPLEGVALAGALDGSAAAGTIEGGGAADSESGEKASGNEEIPVRRAARRWLTQTRHVRLEITGDDLLVAGILAGPEIGRRLEAVLDLRLDGQIPADAQAQLAAALQA